MSATWHTLIIKAPNTKDRATFWRLATKIGAIPAAKELELNLEETTCKTQAGASLILQQNLHRKCQNDPSIVWCSLKGPRATFYLIKSSIPSF